MTKARIKRLGAIVNIFLFVGMFAFFSMPGTASASEAGWCGSISKFGRAGCHGYFGNAYFYGTYGIQGENVIDCTKQTGACTQFGASVNNSIPTSINTAAEFENFIDYYLSTGYTYNHAGAAFIVDTMLGRPGSSFTSVTAGIQYAVDHFDDWKTKVVDYAAVQGRITWDSTQTIPAGTIDSMHACTTTYYQCTQANVGSHDGKDLMFFRRQDAQLSHLIIFNDGLGTGASHEFAIRRECANLVGAMSPPIQEPTVQPATCNGYTVNPEGLDPTTSYQITARIQYKSTADATTANASSNFFLKVTGPNVNYNNANVSPVTQSGSILTIAVNFGPTGAVGTYQIQWGMTGGAGSITCGGTNSTTFDVSYHPYFSVLGGDITAGPGFGDASCSGEDSDITSWNANSGSYAGGGSQLGAIATGDITNFVSGLGLTGGAASHNGYGLSFSNAANIGGAGNYGGQFGSDGIPCLNDAYSAANGTALGTTFDATNIPGATGTYSFNANAAKAANFIFTLGSGTAGTTMTIPAGDTISIYVSGDVYIKNNIVYAPYSLTNVPRLNLYVSGNIFIDPKVTQLHGVYVAQKSSSSTGGDIDTCATSTTSITQPVATCSTQLTVVGAMEAEDQLALTRTYGNVTAVPASGIPAAPAETFQYSPELWLNVPSGSNKFDIKAYTSLPPVL